MTAFTIVAVVIGLILLASCVVLLVQLRQRLRAVERLLAARPPGLDAQEATAIAEAAARQTAALVDQGGLPRALMMPASASPRAGAPRLSGPRIKASGWAAGASEAVRRLRMGA